MKVYYISIIKKDNLALMKSIVPYMSKCIIIYCGFIKYCIQYNAVKCLQYLVDNLNEFKLDININICDGETPLTMACSMKNRYKCVKILLKGKAYPNKTNKKGITPITLASLQNNISSIAKLKKYINLKTNP